MKKVTAEQQGANKIVESETDCNRRKKILEGIRTGQKFNKFTDNQVMLITDPQILAFQ